MNSREFTNHIIQLSKNDHIYLFPDGFADQFGGPKGKKFTSAGLNDLLLDLHSKSIDEQERELEYAFNSWKSELEQLDDVLVMRIRI